MNEIKDIIQKRTLLLTTRLRFSPQIQPTKQAAMDKIIEQILLVASDGNGLSPVEIQSLFFSESGYTINLAEIRDSINRLGKQERVKEAESNREKNRYRLTEKALSEIEEIKQEASRRLDTVARRLFRNAKERPSSYIPPFLECLSHIFSRLGEEYVRVIKGEVSKENFLTFPFIYSILDDIIKKYNFIESSLFKSAISSFLQDSDPEYDLIKWNLAQNYFLMKALGLDPDILPLFKDMFGNSTFYLDTNLIIPALEPIDDYHGSFKALHKACKRLNIKLTVCQISLDELRGWLRIQRELIEKVKDQIPREMKRYLRSTFYQSYEKKKSSGEIIDIDEIFVNFKSPREDLAKLFQVELEDDPWFERERNNTNTTSFSEILKAKYFDIHKRRKNKSAAIHDALLLLWLQKLRNESNGNIWLITADRSLPGSLPQPSNAHPKSLAITQDALLQWISPIGVQEEDERDFAAIFAELIKYRLLPQEKIFNLEDFLVFHELNMSCKDLPAEDVEGCIRYINENAPTLNPLEPADREKLSYEVSKYFADPGRKYKQEISRLEIENIKTKEEYEKRLDKVSKQVRELEIEREKDRKEWNHKTEEFKKVSLKRSARFRLAFVTLVFLLLEGLIFYFSIKYSKGSNIFQRISNSWHFLGAGVVLSIIIGWFILGKKRLEALSWPFTKIFKHK